MKIKKKRLNLQQIAFRKLGSIAKHKQKIIKIGIIRKQAISEIKKIDNNEFFLMGLMLYWAEGTKERKPSKAQLVEFTNSDPRMCLVFLLWLNKILKIQKNDIKIS